MENIDTNRRAAVGRIIPVPAPDAKPRGTGDHDDEECDHFAVLTMAYDAAARGRIRGVVAGHIARGLPVTLSNGDTLTPRDFRRIVAHLDAREAVERASSPD